MSPTHIAIASAQIPQIAIGICRTSHGNTHTGVAYRHSDGTVHFFHQAWHHDTRDGQIAIESESMGGPFFCVVPAVHPDRALAIAGFFELIASQRQRIGYALRDDPEALFDPNTGILTLANGRGLSCSTFVLVLFRSARFVLIDTTGWPANRPGDAKVQAALIDLLEKTCTDAEHVQAVKAETAKGCERIRPEEAAGAALFSTPAVRHPEAEDAGLFICGGLCLLGQFQFGMI